MEEQLKKSIDNLILKLTNWFDVIVVNLPNILLALIVFVIAVFLSRKVSSKISSALTTRVKQVSIRSLIGSAISITILALGIILVLGIFEFGSSNEFTYYRGRCCWFGNRSSSSGYAFKYVFRYFIVT